jgi:hypothetical protein
MQDFIVALSNGVEGHLKATDADEARIIAQALIDQTAIDNNIADEDKPTIEDVRDGE